MRKSLSLSIPEPCNQNWNLMTPVNKGRHCSTCSKTVYDFTNNTDEEIVKSFLKNPNLCGRFQNKQLNKDLVYSRKSTNSVRTLLASSLFSILSFGTLKIFSQNNPHIVQTDSTKQLIVRGKKAVSILKPKQVSGTVLDENGLPLPGVNIIVKGDTIGTQTDFDGYYKIIVKDGDTLSFTFLGYKDKSIIINDKTNFNFDMEVGELDCENLIVAGWPSPNWRKECERDKKKAARKIERQEKREKIKMGEIERTSLGRFLFKISHPFKKQ